MTGFIKTVSIICVDKLLFAPIHPYLTLISHLLKSASKPCRGEKKGKGNRGR